MALCRRVEAPRTRAPVAVMRQIVAAQDCIANRPRLRYAVPCVATSVAAVGVAVTDMHAPGKRAGGQPHPAQAAWQARSTPTGPSVVGYWWTVEG
jgi:hypothetical protein